MAFEMPPRLHLERGSEQGATTGKTSSTRQQQTPVKKGTPWSEQEHLAFLEGLKMLQKGNWKSISRYYVPSRTPTQVASHAQKHFARLQGVSKRRSRFSALEQAACAQGMLTELAGRMQSAVTSGPLTSWFSAGFPCRAGVSSSLPLPLPLHVNAQPSAAPSQSPEASTSSDATAGPAGDESQPGVSAPLVFTKIYRPTARPGAKGCLQKTLKEELNSLSSSNQPEGRSSCVRIHPSSGSAFRTLPSSANSPVSA